MYTFLENFHFKGVERPCDRRSSSSSVVFSKIFREIFCKMKNLSNKILQECGLEIISNYYNITLFFCVSNFFLEK